MSPGSCSEQILLSGGRGPGVNSTSCSRRWGWRPALSASQGVARLGHQEIHKGLLTPTPVLCSRPWPDPHVSQLGILPAHPRAFLAKHTKAISYVIGPQALCALHPCSLCPSYTLVVVNTPGHTPHTLPLLCPTSRYKDHRCNVL